MIVYNIIHTHTVHVYTIMHRSILYLNMAIPECRLKRSYPTLVCCLEEEEEEKEGKEEEEEWEEEERAVITQHSSTECVGVGMKDDKPNCLLRTSRFSSTAQQVQSIHCTGKL